MGLPDFFAGFGVKAVWNQQENFGDGGRELDSFWISLRSEIAGATRARRMGQLYAAPRTGFLLEILDDFTFLRELGLILSYISEGR